VDLRMHGRSQGLAPPHTVRACAEDLVALERQLPCPVTQIVGHSFGGKVALAYHERRPELERVALLDSAPGHRIQAAGSEQTFAILRLLEAMPREFSRREEFLELVVASGHSRMIAEWLAMNLERSSAGFRFRVQLDAVHQLLTDYFALDLWPVLEGSHARLDVVVGARSGVWQPEDLARFHALAERSPERRFLHVLKEAGHWVHVDAPETLAQVLSAPQSLLTP
jgi:pimeloyl-ACP methyl ester carboxylesterase